jgi:hypothetical protein
MPQEQTGDLLQVVAHAMPDLRQEKLGLAQQSFLFRD